MKATLVGAEFRKGAKAALGFLRASKQPVALLLMREPLNPHDENAIKVCCHWQTFGLSEMSALRAAGAKPSFSGLLMLGYVDRRMAVEWAPLLDDRGGVAKARIDFSKDPPTLTLT